MSTTEVCLTVHLVMTGGHPGDGFLMKAPHEMRDRFGNGDATLQIATGADTLCALVCEHVV